MYNSHRIDLNYELSQIQRRNEETEEEKTWPEYERKKIDILKRILSEQEKTNSILKAMKENQWNGNSNQQRFQNGFL